MALDQDLMSIILQGTMPQPSGTLSLPSPESLGIGPEQSGQIEQLLALLSQGGPEQPELVQPERTPLRDIIAAFGDAAVVAGGRRPTGTRNLRARKQGAADRENRSNQISHARDLERNRRAENFAVGQLQQQQANAREVRQIGREGQRFERQQQIRAEEADLNFGRQLAPLPGAEEFSEQLASGDLSSLRQVLPRIHEQARIERQSRLGQKLADIEEQRQGEASRAAKGLITSYRRGDDKRGILSVEERLKNGETPDEIRADFSSDVLELELDDARGLEVGHIISQMIRQAQEKIESTEGKAKHKTTGRFGPSGNDGPTGISILDDIPAYLRTLPGRI